MQNYNPLRKETAFVVLVLFIGVCIIPSTGSKTVEKPSMPTFDDPTIVSIQPSIIAVEPGETFTSNTKFKVENDSFKIKFVLS